MLCLALKHEDALEWVNWCLHTEQFDREATRLYLCLQALIEIEVDEHKQLDEYIDSLKLMYDEDTLERSLDIISGRDNFSGLHSPGLSLDGFEMHRKLLDGYQKLHVAKQGNWPTVNEVTGE